MPTYIQNAVDNLTAYGYGDTRNGVTAYTPQFEGFQEYLLHKNETFFAEVGNLNIPSLFGPVDGVYITYCNPGLAYRRRLVYRPYWVPKRKDFVGIVGISTPDINDVYNHFNQPGDDGNTDWERVCIKVKAAGFVSWGRPSYFANNFREMIVGANGQFSVQYFAFPYTNVNNPNPGDNYSGVQVGTIIKFFTEDEFSIVCFDTVQSIRTQMNTVPEAI